MAKSRKTAESPACYAMVHPGLEEVAGEEITEDFRGEVKKSSPGIVVFRVPEIDASLLELRTVEDVFVMAWGTDQLSYTKEDLERIRRWTDRDTNWDKLLQIHHAIRPKPKGKPTLHVVTQMTGEHGYRRSDARKAFMSGLAGKFPASWRLIDEDASMEFWLTINGGVAISGLRLSDKTMRHRTWKLEHFPASLRPSLAAAMVRLADIKPHSLVVDPMCGAGTILGEAHLYCQHHGYRVNIVGGDIDEHHVKLASTNMHRFQGIHLDVWDACDLPLETASVDRIISNPPFGKQMSSPTKIGQLYRDSVREMDRVLKLGGKAVLLVAELTTLRQAVESVGWKQIRLVNLRILGQRASIVVYRK